MQEERRRRRGPSLLLLYAPHEPPLAPSYNQLPDGWRSDRGMDLRLVESEMSSTFLFFIALTNMSGVFPISPSSLMDTVCIVSGVAI